MKGGINVTNMPDGVFLRLVRNLPRRWDPLSYRLRAKRRRPTCRNKVAQREVARQGFPPHLDRKFY